MKYMNWDEVKEELDDCFEKNAFSEAYNIFLGYFVQQKAQKKYDEGYSDRGMDE